jgi:hypothetical protein
MEKLCPVYSINIPEYRLDQKPDYQMVGRKMDEAIQQYFSDREIALRCLSLADHPGQTMDSLVETIQRLGTDRYDPDRKGVLHDFYKDRGVDMFAGPHDFTKGAQALADTVENFYEGALQDRGYRVRIDLILVYDPKQLEFVPVDYGNGDYGNDAFRFKNPEEKRKALIGIIKVL